MEEDVFVWPLGVTKIIHDADIHYLDRQGWKPSNMSNGEGASWTSWTSWTSFLEREICLFWSALNLAIILHNFTGYPGV